MNQYLTYAAIGVGILLLSLLVPGLKVIAEIIVKAVMEFLVEILKHKSTFLVWLVKTLVADHVRLLRHALQSRDVLDPTQKVRDATNNH